MTTTLLETRQAIRDVLRDVDGFDNVYDYRNATPTPPCATVGWPPLWLPDQRLGGHQWTATIPIQVLLAMGANDAADRALSAFLEPSGTSSISAAFDIDPTLAGVVGYAVVASVTDIGNVVQFAEGGVQYFSAIFNIEVESG
jgi:hypothetical protein